MLKILIITIIFFIASGTSNLTGFGTGTLSIPLLLEFLPLQQTLLLAGIMQWLSGLWKMLGFFNKVHWPITIFFGLPALIASVIGSTLIFILPHKILYHLFGVILIIYSYILAFVPNFVVKKTWSNTLIGGIIYGLCAGIFGMRGPIRAIFLTAFDLPKRDYIATSGAISLLADISRLFVYIYGGIQLPRELFVGLFLFIPITLIAAYLAQSYVIKIPQRKFEILVAIFLALVGFQLLFFSK